MNAKEILMKQTSDMLSNFDIKGLIEANINTVVNSGCIDTDKVTIDNGIIAKCILAIALEYAAKQYQPLSNEGKKEYKNLKSFI